MSPNIQSALARHGFPDLQQVEGRTSIADLHTLGIRRGIYLLHFRPDEYYIGQALDVTRRFTQHHKRHDDIVAMSFRPVPKDDLSPIEWEAITDFQRCGILLRNIVGVSEAQVDSDFDDIVTDGESQRWLDDISFQDLSGSRVKADDLRRRYHRNFVRLLTLPHAADAIDILKRYVRRCVPFPLRTEQSFWACSCLPSGNSPGQTVFARININWQEVLTLSLQDGQLGVSFHVALSVMQRGYDSSPDRLLAQHPFLEISDHAYVPGGPDQFQAFTPSPATAQAFLDDSYAIEAARLLNIRLMQKGPCTFSRYHCVDLADRLLAPNPSCGLRSDKSE